MICFLTFVIHMVGTLAYAVRIAGVRTRRIAISFSLFNILVLMSRTSNSFQGPFLAKRIESRLLTGHGSSPLLHDFRWLLLTTTVATLAGAVLIPLFSASSAGLSVNFRTQIVAAPCTVGHHIPRCGVHEGRCSHTVCSQRDAPVFRGRGFLTRYSSERFCYVPLDVGRFRFSLCRIPQT